MHNPFSRKVPALSDRPSRKLIGGRLVCGPVVLPVLDFCWTESTLTIGHVSGVRDWTPPPDQQVIVGSVAFVSGSVEDIRGYKGQVFYLNGETSYVLEEAEVVDLRVGTLIHPGHQFISFVCRTLEANEGSGTTVYGRPAKTDSLKQ